MNSGKSENAYNRLFSVASFLRVLHPFQLPPLYRDSSTSSCNKQRKKGGSRWTALARVKVTGAKRHLANCCWTILASIWGRGSRALLRRQESLSDLALCPESYSNTGICLDAETWSRAVLKSQSERYVAVLSVFLPSCSRFFKVIIYAGLTK